MLWCYLDDSGTDGTTPTVTMAGYVADYRSWRHFERQSRKLFASFGIQSFHAKEFHDHDAPFDNWTITREGAFIDGWMEIARQHALAGITVSIAREAFGDYKKKHQALPNKSAYGHCFDCAIDFLLSDDLLGAAAIEHGISFFVEAGTNANAGVLDIFNARKHADCGFFQQMSFIDKNACHAIQLSDFLAFYSRRHGSRFVANADTTMPPLLELAKEKVRIIAQLADGFVRVPRSPLT